MTERARLLGWALAASLFASGCICCGLGPSDGNTARGRLTVQPTYTIAQGAHLLARVEAGVEPPAPVTLKRAESESASVARASVADAQTVRIDGLAPGWATITLEAEREGDALEDTLAVKVDPIKGVELEACASVGPSLYLAGHVNAVRYKLVGARREAPPRGRGLYPIRVEPPQAAKIVVEDSAEDYIALDIAPNAPEQLRIVSTLPGDHHELTIKVARPEDVKIALLNMSAPDRVTKGLSAIAYIHYSTHDHEHGSASICAMLPYIAEVTGDECRLSAHNALKDAGKSIYGAGVGLVVEGLRVGMCKLSVRTEISDVAVFGAAALIAVEALKVSASGGGGFDFD